MAQVRIQVRREPASEWTTSNPVLSQGEFGLETDSGRFKIGDGIRSWSTLPYASGPLPADTSPLDVGNRNAGSSLSYARADHSHAFPSSVTFSRVTAGEATIAGTLSVTGSLIGGTHTHVVDNIVNWDSAVSDAVFANLLAGAGVSLSRDEATGVTTITATGSGGGAVTSVAGRSGDVLLTSADLGDFPAPLNNTGKYLRTDGAALEWADPLENGGVSTVNDLTGNVVLTAGANVTLTSNPSTGVITIAASGTSGTGDVTSVNALVGDVTIAAAAGSGLSVAASGTTITLDAAIAYDDLVGVPATFAPSAHTHAPADITGLQEFVEDTVDGLLVAGTNVTLAYDDAAGTLTISAEGADAPTLVAGAGIDIDTGTPGEATISVSGLLDGGAYDGYQRATDPPYFSVQPQSQLVTFGSAIFTARVENAVNEAYQWQKASAGAADFYGLSDTSPFSGTATDTLTVSPVSDSDNGSRFRLVVTLPDGSVLVSDEAVLSTVALVITDHPLPGEFEEATTIDVEAFLLVLAEGGSTPYAYQWQKWSGSAWADIPGETDYFIDEIDGTLAATDDVRVDRYRVKVTDANGIFVFSDQAFITIRAGLPEITLDPTGQPISGGGATFTAEYQGNGVSASWERRLSQEEQFSAIGKEGLISTPSPGTYRSTLTLSGLTGNDNGSEYRLRVSNSAGDAVSAAATLGSGAPIISSQPQSTTVIENNTASFTVIASYSDGPLTYQWQERTVGGSFVNLSGATSSTLTLTPASVTLGRDGSAFRCVVTGGGVPTYSKEALLTVISAPDAGDAVFIIQPTDMTVEEGGAYPIRAASTWLSSANHYAFARVEYDDGTIEYHPLSSGTPWNGTAARLHQSLAYQQYTGSLQLWKSAWVSVCASLSDPEAYTVSGTTSTLQPFAFAKFDVRSCTAQPDVTRIRPGVIKYPVSQTIPISCQGSATLNVPDPPYTYVESKRARVTISSRQAFIGPVPNTGFWDPPTVFNFTGAADLQNGIVLAAGGSNGMYFRAEKKGVAGWETRAFPFSFSVTRIVHCWDKFYAFGVALHDPSRYTALVSSDDGATFEETGWNFGQSMPSPSFVGGKLFAPVTTSTYVETAGYAGKPVWTYTFYRTVWVKTQVGPWVAVNFGVIGQQQTYAGGASTLPDAGPAVSYAHGRYFLGTKWSTDGTSWSQMQLPPGASQEGADSYMPVELADASQNYVLTSNGYRAPAPNGVATGSFSRVSNGASGIGPQAGSWIYTGVVDGPTKGQYWHSPYTGGAAIYRKGAGNPAANELLFSHSRYWNAKMDLDWADVQIMSYTFGGDYGDNLDLNYWGPVSEPYVPGYIFLDDRVIHLFRYRNSSSAPPSGGGGSIPTPPRR